jgi:hypothetical protein
MDMMGPEAWTRWELEGWVSDQKTMPLQCLFLATIAVTFMLLLRRASKEDKENR